MKIKKSFFDIWVILSIFIIFFWNIWLNFLFQKYNIDINSPSGLKINILSLFIQSVFVLIIIWKIYIAPLNLLNTYISDFISWKNKWEKINIKTNYLNPNIERILKFFDIILNALKNIKDEFLSWKAIKWEVELATELQEKLLKKIPEKIPSFDIIAKSKPAWEIGWDSYDIIKQNDNYYIYVWDATWHWVWAWFVMVMVNALISWFSKIFKSWAEILANTNEILKPRIKSNILMSLLLVRWNEIEKRLFMSWAWHEYLIIYKHALKKCFTVKSWWVALWMTKNIHKIIKESEIEIWINDVIVLYTDWITEAINQKVKNWNEQMFWEKRLIEAIEKTPLIRNNNIELKTAQSVFNNITIEFSRFWWYKNIQLDDITLVVAHYKWNQEIIENTSKEISEDFITEWNW